MLFQDLGGHACKIMVLVPSRVSASSPLCNTCYVHIYIYNVLYICVYRYIYIYTSLSIYTHIYIHTYIFMYVYIHRKWVYIYIYTYIYIHMCVLIASQHFRTWQELSQSCSYHACPQSIDKLSQGFSVRPRPRKLWLPLIGLIGLPWLPFPRLQWLPQFLTASKDGSARRGSKYLEPQ